MSNNQFDKLIELIQQHLEQLSNNELKIIAASLSGVVLGFVLYVIKDWLTDRKIKNKQKNAVLNELRTNLGLIDQKKHILQQLYQALKNNRILNTLSPDYSTSLYDKYIGDIGIDLSKVELSCLHIIYEYFKLIDKYMNNFLKEFIENKNLGVIQNIYENYMNECKDVIDKCDLLKELVKEYLDGKPRNLLWEDDQAEDSKKSKDYLRNLLNKKE